MGLSGIIQSLSIWLVSVGPSGMPLENAPDSVGAVDQLKEALNWVVGLDFLPGLIVVGVYTLFWSLSRWHNIALPSRKLLRAQIEGLRSRLYTENSFRGSSEPDTDSNGSGGTDNSSDNSNLIKRLEKQLTEIVESQHLGGGLFNFIFWSRGHLIAGWKEVHDIERQFVELYSEERTEVYLAVTEGSLRDIESNEATYLADKIKALGLIPISRPEQSAELTRIYNLLDERLEKKHTAKVQGAAQVQGAGEPNDKTLKALLQEALRIIYGYNDDEYAKLVTWHNKAAWLMVVALALIFLILSYHSGGAALLLAGAVGGLISRLTRTIRNRRAVPTDYGAYWTSIYLSPVLGALAAWAGVLLLAAFGSLNVLSGPFEQVRWQDISLQDGSFVYADEDTEASETATQSDPRTFTFCFSICENDTPAETVTVPNEIVLTLGIAVLFGFSERLLSNFTGKLEGAFEKKPAADA